MTVKPFIIVVGGSYVGTNVAKKLASMFHDKFDVLVVEKNSHFQHLFAFPRFAVTTEVDTHKAFIPYNPGTFAECPPGSGVVVQALVTDIQDSTVILDRPITLGTRIMQKIPFSFLVLATGTALAPPSSMPTTGKVASVQYLRAHADAISKSQRIAIIGGGAVGVQMALDMKEIYPEKKVMLIHSREQLMHNFHANLDAAIKLRCAELGVELVLGERVTVPNKGYPNDGTPFSIERLNGSAVETDFAVVCTGQRPQSALARKLSTNLIDQSGYVRVLKTLQVDDAQYPNIFAIGDVAATGAHKAAKPANQQAAIVANNIEHLIKNEPLESYEVVEPPGIHLTLGLKKSIAFGNPVEQGANPFTKHRDDGAYDMNIDRIWTRKAGGPDFYA